MDNERPKPKYPVIPPPGARLPVGEWSRLVVAEVRRRLPDVVATAKGSREVILRHHGRAATIHDEGGSALVTFDENGRSPMPPLHDDERLDRFTARNIGHSIAGFFDGKLARSD